MEQDSSITQAPGTEQKHKGSYGEAGGAPWGAKAMLGEQRHRDKQHVRQAARPGGWLRGVLWGPLRVAAIIHIPYE